jgi:CheY-like chemotaxis protein
MCAMHSDPLAGSRAGGRTNFPTVPIQAVPAPNSPAGGRVDPPVVLVVDHEPGIADKIAEILKRSGYAAIPAYNGEDALETALLIPPDLVITGLKLPDISGIEVAAVLREKLPDCKVLLLAELEAHTDLPSGEHRLAVVDRTISPPGLLAHVADRLKPKPS